MTRLQEEKNREREQMVLHGHEVGRWYGGPSWLELRCRRPDCGRRIHISRHEIRGPFRDVIRVGPKVCGGT